MPSTPPGADITGAMTTPHHLHWGAEALWQALEPLLPGLSVEVVARLGSTNTELLERMRRIPAVHGRVRSGLDAQAPRGEAPDAAAGERLGPGRRLSDTQPCLLVAEHQTRGRGRQGKDWRSSPGASLTFSLALPLAPADWSGLSLAVGLAVAEAFDPLAPGATPRLGLKWPNDLLLIDTGAPGIGRKLGGILIETVQLGDRRMAVVGIGLNLLPQPPDGAEPALSWGYACMQELSYGMTAPAALAQLALPLVRSLLAFEREGFAPLRERYAVRDVLLGRAVVTTLPGLPAGVADGVDDSGTLWLRVDGQRRPVASGEVSLRPHGAAGDAAAAPPC